MNRPEDYYLDLKISEEHVAGVYANFANVSHSEYDVTVTFARVEHESEQLAVPGNVASRVNMSHKFAEELLAALQDNLGKRPT